MSGGREGTARWVRLLVVFLLLLGVTACLWARSEHALPESGSPIDPAGECQTIEQLLAPAHPEPIAARHFKRLHACPEEAGEAIAVALDTLRGSADTLVLRRVADMTQRVHDARIFEVSLDIAEDSSASIEARVFAFRSLIWSIAPAHQLTYEKMMLSPPEARCGAGSDGMCWSSAWSHFYQGYTTTSLRWPVLGRPLPEDFVSRVSALCPKAIEGRAGPVHLAAAQTCWWTPDRALLDLVNTRSSGPQDDASGETS